jgi:hypothetical protein
LACPARQVDTRRRIGFRVSTSARIIAPVPGAGVLIGKLTHDQSGKKNFLHPQGLGSD